MKRRITAIAAAALMLAAASVSCGEVGSGSDSVTVDTARSTKASTEASSENTEASSEEKTSEKTTKKSTEASSEGSTEADTENQTEEATEKQTEEVTEKQTEAPTERQTEAPTQAPSGTAVNGSYYLGTEISEITDVFGTPSMTYMAPACMPIGDDGNSYVYEFNGLKVDCYCQSGTYYAATVAITGSNYSTPEGITVGSSKSAAEAAYGTGMVQGNGDILYNKGSYNLYLTMNGDTVSQIDYELNY
ncbi:MAG: hypothetical protein IKO47_05200 [Ruminococcus sp.]|nr:hypothetical protein [Ruminococcus sp.]